MRLAPRRTQLGSLLGRPTICRGREPDARCVGAERAQLAAHDVVVDGVVSLVDDEHIWLELHLGHAEDVAQPHGRVDVDVFAHLDEARGGALEVCLRRTATLEVPAHHLKRRGDDDGVLAGHLARLEKGKFDGSLARARWGCEEERLARWNSQRFRDGIHLIWTQLLLEVSKRDHVTFPSRLR